MPIRSYRLGRRGQAAEETRQRIVDATFALHTEKGIVGTSMKDIAERAEVSVGTVYHHFPTYDDAIGACGAFVAASIPAPSAAIFAGLESAEERLQRLALESFRWFERMPAFAHVRSEQDRVPILRPFVEGEERNRMALTREALKPLAVDKKKIATAAALLDMSVFGALRRTGLSTPEAARQITSIILAWLASADASPSARGRRKRPN
jgi:AcrR family transcriptional regulator